jgi:quinol monooxygenase YgiN
MYGTIARLRIKPGKEAELRQQGQDMSRQIPGLVFHHVYKSDSDPNELYLVVAFESKQAYRDNAESPEQNERYKAYRALLDADPEWHDGEIIDSYSA